MNISEKIEILTKTYDTISKVFYDISGLEINYKKTLKAVLNSHTDRDFYMSMCAFVASCNDGHTRFVMPKTFLKKMGYLPFCFTFAGGKYYLIGGSEQYEVKSMPTEIATLNGRPFNEYIKQSLKLVQHKKSGLTFRGRLEEVLPLFLKKKGNVAILSSGEKIKFDLASDKPSFNSTTGIKNCKYDCVELPCKNIVGKIFGDNILYVKLDTFNSAKTVNECIEIMKKYEFGHLILDVRDNDGGMTAYAEKVANLIIPDKYSICKKITREIIGIELASASQYEKPQNVLDGWIATGITTPKIIASQKAILQGKNYREHDTEFGKTDRTCLNYKSVTLLTSKYTFSAAEDFVAMFKCNHKATIIGEATYGSTGTPYIQKFKDGSTLFVCSVKYLDICGKPFIGNGIEPDVFVPCGIKNLQSSEDCVLKCALKHINGK